MKIGGYFEYVSLTELGHQAAIDASVAPRIKKSWVPNWLYKQRFRSDWLYDLLTEPDPFYISAAQLKVAGDKFYSDLRKIIEEDK
jgi:hypothetical protein